MRQVSLGARLAAMTTLVLLIASALVYFQVTTHERERLVASKATTAEMVANVVAGDLAPSLDFDDPVDAVAHLDALKSDPEILGAAVWRAGGGQPFASWSRAGHAPLAAPDPADDGKATRFA